MIWIRKGIKVGMFAVVFCAVAGFVVRELWNWLLPGITGWHAITFWQAIGLLVLCRILFGGFRGGHGGGRWKHRLRERMDAMSPEQREEFRRHLHGCCGHRRRGEASESAAV